jgi:probable F420-dependent oxidoreductase
MKLSIDFPSVVYREGPVQVIALIRALEALGFDDLAVFDHVVMPYPSATRDAPMFPPRTPFLEPLSMLAFAAAVTSRITLSTAVLVLPQRQAVLVAKQASTIDVLAGGRLRLGVGVGCQDCEYAALGEEFFDRGRRMDETIDLLRSCWSDEQIDAVGTRFNLAAIAMEPKPPQGRQLPIWIGGSGPAAIRRAARLGDGWIAAVARDDDETRTSLQSIWRHAELVGRDPASIELQSMLAPPPRSAAEAELYQDADQVAKRAEQVQAMGFGWLSLNATAVFQSGARTVDAIVHRLGALHARLRAVVG